MFNPEARSERYDIDSKYRSGKLTFSVDPDAADHQVVVATAKWFGILGVRKVEYVFLVTNTG